MKNDTSRRFHLRVVSNIFYSTLATCLIEIFLIQNILLLARYMEQRDSRNALFTLLGSGDMIVVIVYVLIGIIIFSLIFLMLQEKSTRYIEQISDAMQSISQGDLNTQVEVKGDDEFSSMASNLNRMVEEIRELMDREREAEQSKNELITNVAHDLRTPLTSIIGYLELLSGNTAIPGDMRTKYIEIAFNKSKRLEKLIEDLFGFTKQSNGKIAMNVTKVDIVKLLGQLLNEFYPSFMGKELSFELQSNVPAKVINADGNLLARLFDNLINNAIKYGSDGKRIIVKVTADEEIVSAAVINFGHVIPADELPFVFERFFRVEQSRSTDTGGTGLGLAIAKNIVEMHGGMIDVKSDLKGTVFTVRLQVNFDINKENFGKLG